MFSDHLRKIDTVSNSKLFLIAGLLVIVCQLAAMAMVVGGQVEKAQLQGSRLAVERVALANCMQTGAGRNGCAVQARPVYDRMNSVLPDVAAIPGEFGNAEGRLLSQQARHQAGLMRASADMMAVSFVAP